MGKKFKIGAAVTIGAAVAFIFAKGIKAIVDDIKMDEMLCDEDDDNDDDDGFFEDEDIMKEKDGESFDCNGCDGSCGKCEAHKNFTEPDEVIPVEENADEAAAQTVSSENMTEANA